MSTDTRSRLAVKRVKKSSGNFSRETIPGAASLPQVNLLPPSVRARRALQRVKVYLLLTVCAVILLALLGYIASMLAARSAQAELEVVQAETSRLQQEQAKYSEVPRVKKQIADTELARTVGMGSEVLWSDHIHEILMQMPAGSSVTSLATTAMNPLQGPPVPVDPLVGPGIATLAMTHRSPTLPDTSAWIDMLNGLDGMHDAQALTQTVSEEDGVIYYEVATTVQLGVEALSGRFDGEGETE